MTDVIMSEAADAQDESVTSSEEMYRSLPHRSTEYTPPSAPTSARTDRDHATRKLRSQTAYALDNQMFSRPPLRKCDSSVRRIRRKKSHEPLPTISLSHSCSLYETLLPASNNADRIELAAKYIRDAHMGRKVSLQIRRFDSPVLSTLASLYRSSLFQMFLKVVTFFHCALIIFEGNPYTRHIRTPTTIFEIVFVLVYMLDLWAGMVEERVVRYLSDRWHACYALTVLAICLDIVVSLAATETELDVLRLLRPLLFLFKTKTLLSPFITMIGIVPRVLRVLVLAAVLVGVYSVVGMAIFRGVYIDPYQNFNNVAWGGLALGVLLSTENFPDILLPGMYDQPVNAAFFFVSFIAIGVWIYMSLLIAVIFDEYKKGHEEYVIARRVDEQQALLLAFSLLNSEDQTIDYNIFEQLVSKIRPTGRYRG